MRAIFLFSFVFWCASTGAAEKVKTSTGSTAVSEPTTAGGAGTSLSWEEPGPRTLTARIGYVKPSLGINVSDRNGLAREYRLVPNTPTRTFISGSYDWLGATVSWANPTTATEDYLYGLSTSEDFQLRLFLRRHAIEFTYQKYRGYYLEEAPTLNGQSELVPYPQFPDLETARWGLNVLYNFHPEDFSMSAAYDQGKQQKESGWAWLVSGSLNYDRFSSSQSLVPTVLQGKYGTFEKVRNGTLYSLLLGGGVGGTWVFWGNCFLSGTIIFAFGPELKTVTLTDKTETHSSVATTTHGKFSLGYNGKRFIIGITQQLEGPAYSIENGRLSITTQEISSYLGTRFFF